MRQRHEAEMMSKRERQLRQFVVECVEQAREGLDIDGGWFQDTAVEYGVLEAVTMAGPCDDEDGESTSCPCAEADPDGFPMTCYRVPEWLWGSR